MELKNVADFFCKPFGKQSSKYLKKYLNKQRFFKNLKKHRLIILIFLLAVAIRLGVILSGNVFFYFDQARDAAISTQIIKNFDIKIQGPSVSGTGDSVYHGVLYYYLIAPVYFLSGGSPVVVSAFLAIFGSLSVFVIYALGIKVFDSKNVGLLAGLLLAVSAIAVHQHIWLSNPQLNSVFLPITYLLIWRTFYSQKPSELKHFILLGIFSALSMQAALQSVVVLGSIFIAVLYKFATEKSLKAFSIKQIFGFGLPFLAGISTMLLTQFLLWKNGILSLESLRLSEHSVSFLESLAMIVDRYGKLIRDLLLPNMEEVDSWFGVLLGMVLAVMLFIKDKKKQLIWSASFFLAPLWLLVWHYRDPNHSFIGSEVVLLLVVAWAVWELCKLAKTRILGNAALLIFVIFFLSIQSLALNKWISKGYQYFGIQKGGMLRQQLALIDKTYEIADGTPFTISTLTSPFAINTTWGYLYDWRGSEKYGSEPKFVGMSQFGYPGEGLLEESDQPEQIHFAIIEPDTTLSDETIADFVSANASLTGSPGEKTDFGTVVLYGFGE